MRVMVVRIDDNGVMYLVKDGLTATQAAFWVTDLDTHGHKQSHITMPYRDAEERDQLVMRFGIVE